MADKHFTFKMTCIEYKRELLSGRYHRIHIYECPMSIFLFAAAAGSSFATVENCHNYFMPATIALSITNDDVQVMPRLLRYELDFVIPKDAFFRLTDIWDKQGCYVNFHEQEILKFKASAMEGVARYRALDNFGWTLELALPGPTGGEWGYFTSPDKDIIDRVENGLVNYKCPDHQ